MARESRRVAALALAIFLLVCFLSGCSWRTVDAEHYFGPVLYRFSDPLNAQAHVAQVRRIGVSAEAGTNWGIAIGMADRIVIAPKVIGMAEPEKPQTPAQNTDSGASEDWHLSLLYLKIEPHPDSFFIAREVYGAGAVLGDEAHAISVGFASRTLFRPPANSLSQLHFVSSHPLQAKAALWRASNPIGPVSFDFMEKLTQ